MKELLRAEGGAILPAASVWQQAAMRTQLARWGLAGWHRTHGWSGEDRFRLTPVLMPAFERVAPAWAYRLLVRYLSWLMEVAGLRERELRQLLASAAGCTVPMRAGDVLWMAHDVPHMTQGGHTRRTALIIASCANCVARGPAGSAAAAASGASELSHGATSPPPSSGSVGGLREVTELRRQHDEAFQGSPAWLPLPEWHRIRCSSGMCIF